MSVGSKRQIIDMKPQVSNFIGASDQTKGWLDIKNWQDLNMNLARPVHGS
jgi:hypothetical protein